MLTDLTYLSGPPLPRYAQEKLDELVPETSSDIDSPDVAFSKYWKEYLDKLDALNTDAINEAAAQRSWSAEEAEKVREFNKSEAELARQFAAEQTEAEFQFNSAEAAKARQWQEDMSNTSYQRAIKDLEAAGLNPILAYQQGGASVSGSPMASGSASSSATAASGGNPGGSKASLHAPSSQVLSSAINSTASLAREGIRTISSLIDSFIPG